MEKTDGEMDSWGMACRGASNWLQSPDGERAPRDSAGEDTVDGVQDSGTDYETMSVLGTFQAPWGTCLKRGGTGCPSGHTGALLQPESTSDLREETLVAEWRTVVDSG